MMANKAPAPNRRSRFPFRTLAQFGYPVCAPPSSPAAVGEARQLGKHGKEYMKTQIVIIITACCLCAAAAESKESKEPTAQVEGLVQRLESGKTEGVFVDFFAGSLVAEQKEMQVRAMDAQAKAAFEIYGKPTDYELTETNKMGNSLVRIKWITKHKNGVPLFWNGLFYRRNDKWEPLSVVFFDDPTKAGF
jgi:hypothetical protein